MTDDNATLGTEAPDQSQPSDQQDARPAESDAARRKPEPMEARIAELESDREMARKREALLLASIGVFADLKGVLGLADLDALVLDDESGAVVGIEEEVARLQREHPGLLAVDEEPRDFRSTGRLSGRRRSPEADRAATRAKYERSYPALRGRRPR